MDVAAAAVKLGPAATGIGGERKRSRRSPRRRLRPQGPGGKRFRPGGKKPFRRKGQPGFRSPEFGSGLNSGQTPRNPT